MHIYASTAPGRGKGGLPFGWDGSAEAVTAHFEDYTARASLDFPDCSLFPYMILIEYLMKSYLKV